FRRRGARRAGATLFPYTTLFRSRRAVGVGDRGAHVDELAERQDAGALGAAVDGDDRVGARVSADAALGKGDLVLGGVHARDGRADRESTRLTCGDDQKSYAVCCL